MTYFRLYAVKIDVELRSVVGCITDIHFLSKVALSMRTQHLGVVIKCPLHPRVGDITTAVTEKGPYSVIKHD